MGEQYWHTYTYRIYYLPQFYTDPLKSTNLASKCWSTSLLVVNASISAGPVDVAVAFLSLVYDYGSNEADVWFCD